MLRRSVRISPNTMNTTEDFARSDVVDSDMTVLTPEDVTGQNVDSTDEVENLRNRYVVDSNAALLCCLSKEATFDFLALCYLWLQSPRGHA